MGSFATNQANLTVCRLSDLSENAVSFAYRPPTLFICGEKDFNVPLTNSEQMYMALRSLGIPTQLVIYPGQYH
jgi:dipeptidyl aminopeptidase/acylaminoacyl peptidase